MKKTVDENQMDIFGRYVKNVSIPESENEDKDRLDPGTFTPVIRDGVLVKTYEELIEWEENADD